MEISELASGDKHSCVVAKKKVYCWGRNYSLGIETLEPFENTGDAPGEMPPKATL